MKNTLHFKKNGTQTLSKQQLQKNYGGSPVGALALGLGVMVFAYQFGKDVAKWVKEQENK